MKVVYAHTDSLYVPIPSIEKSEEIQEILNKHIQDVVFPNVMGLEEHPMDLEFEKYYSVLGVGATKNRNAGLINWKDGVYLHEPEFVCTGFALKRIAESVIGKETQRKVIDMWIGQKTEDEIVDYCCKRYNDVAHGRVDKTDIVKRSRVRGNRMVVQCGCKKKYDIPYVSKLLSIEPEYYCESDNCKKKLKNCTTVEGKRPTFGGGFAGLLYYNEHVNPKNKINDSFYHMACSFGNGQTYTDWNGMKKPARYIAVKEHDELVNFNPDWGRLAQSEVLQKVKPIFDAMNWDIAKIQLDEKQKKLGEWF
jgi:DNA polymerase elongation subunit (family B)